MRVSDQEDAIGEADRDPIATPSATIGQASAGSPFMMPLVSTVTKPISMPTLRSMPPKRMTTVCPTDTMPSTDIALIRS